MGDSRYAHVFGRLKSLENRMLSKNHFQQIVEAKEKSQIGRILSDTTYAEDVEKLEPGLFFLESTNKFKKFMLSLLPGEKFFDIYFSKEDFSNVKLFIKSGNVDFEYWNNISPDIIREYIETGRNHFPEPFNILIPEALKIKEDSVFEAEIFLDKSFFAYMLKYTNPFWIKYIRNLIDITNFMLIFRCHNFGMTRDFFSRMIVPGGYVSEFKLGKAYTDSEDNAAKHFMASDYFKNFFKLNEIYSKDKDFAQIEKEMDNMLISITKEAKFLTLSVETVIAFVLGIEFELKNLKMILEGKFNNVPETVIKERLRETYV
ncbi:MAG: V-type ATPase subunit [Candidatus Muirbacterium halophilum]|nr:V-type ATPase subunit [Candidatus Muirbacterium halophilum]MCK9477847.1 V-type ATPase subunit [Candidatus Muirbacterium halophilum]